MLTPSLLVLLAHSAWARPEAPRPLPLTGWAGLDGTLGAAGYAAGASEVPGAVANRYGGVGPWASVAATWRVGDHLGLGARLAGGGAFGRAPRITVPEQTLGEDWAAPIRTSAGAGFLALEARWLGDGYTLGLGPAYGYSGSRTSGEVDGVANVPVGTLARGPAILVEGALVVHEHKKMSLGPGLQVVVHSDGDRVSTWAALNVTWAWDAQYPPESR